MGAFGDIGLSDEGIKQTFLCNFWAWSDLSMVLRLYSIVVSVDGGFLNGPFFALFCNVPFHFVSAIGILCRLLAYFGAPFWCLSFKAHVFLI